MRYLKLSALLACAAALAVTSSCNDMPAPLEPEPIELDLQVQRAPGSGEVCWYVTASHPKYNRHVVSWQGAWSKDGFVTDYGYRFGEPLPAGEYEDFFPEAPPLVAHVINLCKDGSQATADRVGNGYVVSVVEKEGKNKYNMFHQIVLQPWMDLDYNQGLCDTKDQKLVDMCVPGTWDEDGECTEIVERPSCVGSFLGTSSKTAPRLPVSMRGVSMTFDYNSWDGFGALASGNLNHGYEAELREGTGEFEGYALLYGWHHGRICVTFDAQPEPVGPKASFTVHCNGLACTFTDASTAGDAAINSWNWDFGDGSTSTVQDPTHDYEAYDTYSVTLTVTDADGLQDVAMQEVNVTDPDDPGPEPGDLSIDLFELTNTSNPQFARVRVDWAVSGEELETVTLEITGPNSNSDSMTWTVSGSSASGQHEFSFRRGFGEYTVTLTVIDGEGNEESEDKTIQL